MTKHYYTPAKGLWFGKALYAYGMHVMVTMRKNFTGICTMKYTVR